MSMAALISGYAEMAKWHQRKIINNVIVMANG
jgi:hypothetical protein